MDVDVLSERNLLRLEVDTSIERTGSYQASNDCSKIKDHPEPADVFAFGLFRGIRHQDCAFCCPQQGGTKPEQRSRKDGEAGIPGGAITQKSRHINAITKCTNNYRYFDAQHIDKCACKEAEDGKSRIKCRIGIVGHTMVDLPTAAYTGQRIEHSGAEEAHKRDDHELYRR
jgi:hypothetical protein